MKGKQNRPASRAEEPNDLELVIGRRFVAREWRAQVDFWEGVKEFILKRVPASSRSLDQLY